MLALVEQVAARYAVDRDRVLVTGFSLGGAGTWFFATRHANVFTGAIPMAGAIREISLDGLGSMPVHIVHSRDDEVVPYGPAGRGCSAARGTGPPSQIHRAVWGGTLQHGGLRRCATTGW